MIVRTVLRSLRQKRKAIAAKRTVIMIAGMIFLCQNAVFAEDALVLEKIKDLEARIEVLEKKTAEQDKCIKCQETTINEQKKKLSDYETRFSKLDERLHRETGRPIEIGRGLEISAGATMVLQGTNNTNNAAAGAPKKKSRADASYSADVTLSNEFENINGRVFLHLEGGIGDGLEDNLTLYSNVNRDADNNDNIRITELWCEQGFFGEKFDITFGKLDPTIYFDNNEAANDETTQFLGRIFRNSPTIEFPDSTAGIRLACLPFEWLELNYGVFDAKSSWERILGNLFHIGEVKFKTNFHDMRGNYRFLGWCNNANHEKWLDTAKTGENAYGFGLSFDQKIHDAVTAFARYGWQSPKTYNPDITATGSVNYSLTHSWSTGFQLEGKPWKRDDDVLSFAVGQIFPSRDYKNAGAGLDPARRGRAEGHLETYYRLQLNKHLAISPNFQYIWNPFGRDVVEDTDGIFVGGARVQIDF